MNTNSITVSNAAKRQWLKSACAALLAIAALTGMSSRAEAGVFVSVGFAPPPLPYYAQPIIPAAGYIWTPGYWAYSDDGGYFWVPGTWVLAPFAGALWTPGYWGWNDGFYVFHDGYWGRHVGFYGGINYGYGYGGVGYSGGYWRGNGFYYNRSVNHVGGNIANVYNRNVINNVTRTSFNGGRGGIAAQATPQEAAFAHEQHIPPIAAQQQQISMARQYPGLRAAINHGAPAVGATPRAGVFAGRSAAVAGAAFSPQVSGAHTERMQGVATARVGETPALRSANYAPHMSMPNFSQRSSGATAPQARTYRAQSTYRPTSSGYRAQTQTSYRAQAQTRPTASYRPAAHASAARPSAAHAARPAAAHGAEHH